MGLRLSLAQLEGMNTAGARKALSQYRKSTSSKTSSEKKKAKVSGEKQPTQLEQSFYDQIKAASLPEPCWHKKELRFHSKRRWRFDFAFTEQKVAVELEGGTYSHGKERDGKKLKSRHLTPTGFYNDCHKYAEAALLGWLVIRADAKMVANGEALELTKRALLYRENIK